MKRITLGFGLLAASALIVLSCKKVEPTAPTAADMEFQSALDATWATYVVTDIEQHVAFLAENQVDNNFYIDRPGSYDPATQTGSLSLYRDTAAKIINTNYNITKCLDGKLRDGSIFLRYFHDVAYGPNPDPKARFYHDYGFCGRFTLSNYKVDGWLIETVGGEPIVIYNKAPGANFNPTTTPQVWTIEGPNHSAAKFKFTHPTDTSKNIIWYGTLTKTLLNSTDSKVWKASVDHKTDGAITWSLGIVSYSGTVKGFTSRNKPFAIDIKTKPLLRDFTCSSDAVYGVNSVGNGTLLPLKSTHHPFVAGIISFTTSNAQLTGYPSATNSEMHLFVSGGRDSDLDTKEEKNAKYPRQIYFGEEATNMSYDSRTALPITSTLTTGGYKPICDNSGEILIKGVTYRVDFIK